MKLRVPLKTCVHTWKVNAKCRRIAKPIAAEFGLSVEQFLARWSHNRLPIAIELTRRPRTELRGHGVFR